LPEYPHLQLNRVISGSFDSKGIPQKNNKQEKTLKNIENRFLHAESIRNKIGEFQEERLAQIQEREELGLPPLPDAVPLFLEIDPKDMDSLRTFGIEVISVEEDGIVIGASTDSYNFKDLKKKIERFVLESGTDKDQLAKLWDIQPGKSWKIQYILSEDLRKKWDTLQEDSEYTVDISISVGGYISDPPTQKNQEPAERFQRRLNRWREKKEKLEIQRDEVSQKRQSDLKQFIEGYGGRMESSIVELDDSFGVRIHISGRGLKDLVFNFPGIFDVEEFDPCDLKESIGGDNENENPDFIPPNGDSPFITVIDSGIQEGHYFLKDAIQTANSKSYLREDPSTADSIKNGGHGTRVAGCFLFGNTIPKTGNHKHIAWINNAKVMLELSGNATLPKYLHPPKLMRDVVNDFPDCKAFNLSINATRTSNHRHMSEWAANIDQLIFEKDCLFIISAGNIFRDSSRPNNPGIRNWLQKGTDYPEYLFEKSSRVANPGHASFALTVGSICIGEFNDSNYTSFGKRNDPSSFTRTGPGIWGMVKPDVVEYGGDFVRELSDDPRLVKRPSTSPETTRNTSGGGYAIGSDDIGTSYSAPKVSHLVALILNEWKDATSLFIRSLIGLVARWPHAETQLSVDEKLKTYGYGLPNSSDILENNPYRITFYTESKCKPKNAHIYRIRIPEELRKATDSFDYRIDVSLAYKAKVRRTRTGSKSYVSSWVDWMSSKMGESESEFQSRVLKYTNTEEVAGEDSDKSHIQWNIRERKGWGTAKEFRRNDSSLQKDWAVLKSYEMPEHLSIAVVGHKGWEKDIYKEETPYCLMVSIECLESRVEIYHSIRIENEIELEVGN
jgi:hypothetical protein